MGRQKTTAEFISDARIIHGDKYNYSKTIYKKAREKLTITCRDHGDFNQLATNHLNGYGCIKCGGKDIVSFDDFLIRANEIHGSMYDYSKSNYKKLFSKIKIKCPIHGFFNQLAADHIHRKHGCPKCNGGVSISRKEFIDKSIYTHGNKYDYTLVDYKNSVSKVKIICPYHGVFEQLASSHMHRSGCPACADTGFNPAYESYIYILICESLGMVKVGITRDIDTRVRSLTLETPFEFDIMTYRRVSGADALRMEKEIHKNGDSACLSGFNGSSEWFAYSTTFVEYAINIIDSR